MEGEEAEAEVGIEVGGAEGLSVVELDGGRRDEFPDGVRRQKGIEEGKRGGLGDGQKGRRARVIGGWWWTEVGMGRKGTHRGGMCGDRMFKYRFVLLPFVMQAVFGHMYLQGPFDNRSQLRGDKS